MPMLNDEAIDQLIADKARLLAALRRLYDCLTNGGPTWNHDKPVWDAAMNQVLGLLTDMEPR